MVQTLSDFKQSIRKWFLLILECFLLFLMVICGPIWTEKPTGFFAIDCFLWSSGFFLLIWGSYLLILESRKRKFGNRGSPRLFVDVLFNTLTFLMGISFIGLACFIKDWNSLLIPVALGLIGGSISFMCGWELYKLGNRP